MNHLTNSSNRSQSDPPDSRISSLFEERYFSLAKRNDQMLAKLSLIQWIAAIGFAYWFSPLAWAGRESAIHVHVYAAIFLGGAITSLPVLMAWKFPGRTITRYTIATGQVLWSALLIHLTGGRIETHFHVFASLAILSFYRDLRVLVPATIVVALDHFVRGYYWPESVFGVLNPEWWRFLEHAAWVIFLDVFLIYNCLKSHRELWQHCRQQIELEDAIAASTRLEKLAAVGQLAASVGHELRNPLAAIRNAHTFIRKRINAQPDRDEKIDRFSDIVNRELDACGKIIENLLDFSRPKDPTRSPCPLRPLIDEVISIVPANKHVSMINEISREIPIPDLDKDQFRQVLINLIQNASEAIPSERNGIVKVSAEKSPQGPWVICVEDNGMGIPNEIKNKILQPLFSTKVKGTGLGLAVAAGVVERHGGTLTIESESNVGTVFKINIPDLPEQQVA